MIEIYTIVYCYVSYPGSPKGREIRSAVKRPANVSGKGADISAFSAYHSNGNARVGLVEVGKLYFVYVDMLRLEFYLLTLSAKLYALAPSIFTALYVGGTCSMSPTKLLSVSSTSSLVMCSCG